MKEQCEKNDAVKARLIFVHHSCGGHWLRDDNGGLAMALGEKNYFVSDTNYDWGPDSIGSRTDIGNWWEWFLGPDSERYLNALYTESGQHSTYSRSADIPGGENEIIMFKSCYPNSKLKTGNDREIVSIDQNQLRCNPWSSKHHTVENAKGIYTGLLDYFSTRQDKLFIAVTAPPVMSDEHSRNARAFNNWMKEEWLRGYTGRNVGVFDFYDIMTGGKGDTLIYPTSPTDNHPSPEGNRLATRVFVPFIEKLYADFCGKE